MKDFTLVNQRTGIVAKTNSGKCVFLKYLLSIEKKKFSKIFVICPTEAVNNFYKEFIDPKCIFNSYSEKWVNSLIEKCKKRKIDNPNEVKQVLLIMDDCSQEDEFINSKALKTMATSSRHYYLGFVVLLQYLYQIPPQVRSNLFTLCVSQINQMATNLLADEFNMGNIYDRRGFIEMYHRCSSNYNFLLINCNSAEKNDDAPSNK